LVSQSRLAAPGEDRNRGSTPLFHNFILAFKRKTDGKKEIAKIEKATDILVGKILSLCFPLMVQFQIEGQSDVERKKKKERKNE